MFLTRALENFLSQDVTQNLLTKKKQLQLQQNK